MKKSLRIAFVANTSWSIYNFRLEVAQSFRDLGHEVYAIAPRDKHSEKLIAQGFIFIEAPIKAYSNNPFLDLRYFWFLKSQYHRYRFDHIFHYTIKANIYGSIAARWSGLRSTSVVTGLGRILNIPKGFKKTFLIRLYDVGCKFADQIWFLNQDDQKFFSVHKIGSRRKQRIIPSEGVNLSIFKKRGKKDFSRLVFLFAGRLINEKGISLFIEAARKVKGYYPNAQFKIIGFINSKDRDSISVEKLLIAQNEGIISFLGDTEDIKPFIQEASCIVLPSIYGEGISRILLEANAMSTPAITTQNRGCEDVIVDGFNGFLCENGNLESLVDQIMAYISLDLEAKEAMGNNGRQLIAQKYDINRIVKIYHDHLFVDSLVDQSSSLPQKSTEVKR